MLCDAGPLVALVDRGDPNHQRCMAALKGIDLLVSTWQCFTEAMHLAYRSGGYRIDIPDESYERLVEVAAQENRTPAEWIVARLPLPARKFPGAKTMYDVMAPYLGLISSGPGQPSSEQASESFADYVEEKHRNGHL